MTELTSLEFHPAANLFPMLTGDEYEQLKADIAANGQLEPIWIHPDGRILDGRNRYMACCDLGIEPKVRQWNGFGSAVGFVVSLNIHRRHLTASQRAAIALDVLPMLEAEAKERERVGGLVRQGKETFPYPDDRGQARDQAAAMFQTNGRYVQEAKNIQRADPELFEAIKSGEMTIPEAKKIIVRAERVERVQDISQANAPLDTTRRYPVIYADPPWEYEHSMTNNRRIDNHYPTMELADICAMPVDELATDDAVLFMWATSPKLEEALSVVRAWGFTYRTNMVWVKPQIGMGYYARQQHELLLIATRGSLPVPEPANRPASVFESPRTQHSRKPDEYYAIIEAMYPEYSRIELFSRTERDGWAAWGNQSQPTTLEQI